MTNPSEYIDMKKLLESLLKKTRHSVIKRSDLLDALKEQNFEFIDGSLLKVAQKEKETQVPEPARYIEHLREGQLVPGIIFIDNKCPIKVNFVVEKVLPQPHPDLLYTTFYCRITEAFDLSSSTSSTIVHDTYYYSFEVRASDTLHSYVKAKDALLFVSFIERDAEYDSEYRVFLTKKAAQNAISQWQKNGDFVTSPQSFRNFKQPAAL